MRRAVSILALFAGLLLPVSPGRSQDEPPEPPAEEVSFPLEVRLGARLAGFEMLGAADSYDAVFGDTLLLGGADLELRFAPRWLVRLSAAFGEADGEQVLLSDPPIPTGEPVTLTYLPVHLSAGFLLRATDRWRVTTGAGATLLSWETSSQLDTSSGADPGAHVLLGVERTLPRLGVGAELLYSTIPDAVGEGGASEYYGEDDLGGLELAVTVRWRVGGG